MGLEGEWSWFDISANIPISDVYKNPDETWNRRGLSRTTKIYL